MFLKDRGRVKEILLGRVKGEPRESIRKGFFRKDFGLEGDARSGPGDKQVTIFGAEGIERLSQSPEEGLCFPKFVPTIITEGIALYTYPVGTRFRIGDCGQEISPVRKQCYPECVLIKAKIPCAMSGEVIFSRVVESGEGRVGDAIEIVED